MWRRRPSRTSRNHARPTTDMHRPGESGDSGGGDSDRLLGGVLTVEDLLVLDRCEVVAGGVQPAVVVPVEPLEGGQLDVVDVLPGSAAADQLGLEQADLALSQGVVKGVTHGAHAGCRAGGGQPFGERNRGVLGGFNRSSQHPDERGCDIGTNSSMGVDEDRPAADALAGAATTAA